VTTIARSSFLRRSQVSVAILCLTSHFTPRMAQTRKSHSSNAQARKTINLDITVFNEIIVAGVGHGLGMPPACECANLIGRIDTRARKPAHVSEGFRRR
jgi:hypothetical protein